MASSAIAGVGTVFKRWNTTTTKWDAISEINSISGPSMTKDTIDVTSLDSTGGYREFITGFRDAGTLNLTMNFVRSTYDLMKADFDSDDAGNYEIVLPDGTSLEFEGLVTELPMEISPDDKITASVTIKLSGQVVVASGATYSGIASAIAN
jgi:predicted secreted protein